MLVLLPTQQMDVMRAWDGLPGILANLPGVGSTFAKIVNSLVLRRKGLLAWPNIWAGAEIVPELVGKLEPADVSARVVAYLEQPELLEQMRSQLHQVRGEPGAAQKLVQLVRQALAN
jgi:lipid-A-disaccharide synthase